MSKNFNLSDDLSIKGNKIATLNDLNVNDVKVDGTSIVEGGVANIPIATNNDIQGTFTITEPNTTITLQYLTGMTSIYWGDGAVNNSLTHTYTTVGTYNFIIKGVTRIGWTAFAGVSELYSIIIGYSVTNISSNAFQGCVNLVRVEIANAILEGEATFFGCLSLNKVTVYDKIVLSEGNSAIFQGCTSLENIDLTKFNMIVPYMFAHCTSLKIVNINNDITEIGEGAFYNCSLLKKIYYNGLKSEYDTIIINDGNQPLYDSTKYYWFGENTI